MEQNTANIDRLFSMEPYAGTDESKRFFMQSLKDELIFHYENNEMYKRFCQRKGFDPYGDYSVKDIPPIAVSVFKNLGNDLSSVGADDIKLRLQSSATSGAPSTVEGNGKGHSVVYRQQNPPVFGYGYRPEGRIRRRARSEIRRCKRVS